MTAYIFPASITQADPFDTITKPEPWMQEALCAEIPADLWFPENGRGMAEAKKLCQSCDVINECAEFAMRNNERWGVWGGLSERDRRKMRKARA